MSTNWPSYSCVLVFVYYALNKLGYNCNANEIASQLSICVPKDSNNPYNFRESNDENQWGISPEVAERQINLIFADSKYEGLKFKHLPFNKIPYQLYDYVLEELIQNGLIVGFGYNYAQFSQSPLQKIIKHVSFVESLQEESVTIADYNNAEKINLVLKYNIFISNILEVNDGYWILGRKSDFRFDIWHER